jgi:hypothetical protein
LPRTIGQLDLAQARTYAELAVCELERDGELLRFAPGAVERGWERVTKLLRDGETAAIDLVNAYREAIIAVANALLERESLTREEVAAIVADHPLCLKRRRTPRPRGR